MSEDIWTAKRVLEWIEGFLAKHGDENPRVSAQWLVSEAIGISRMQLFLDLERPLTEEERSCLREWTRRRATGEPLQYITGEVAFRHITLKVRPGVLIPRPETEVLVSEALALLPAAPKPQDDYDEEIIKQFIELGGTVEKQEDNVAEPEGEEMLLIADICTGSGCIACSIANEHPYTRVIATDLSPEAVMLARDNITELELDTRVEVLECDLGDSVESSLMGCFDLVVSNPPYIPTNVLQSLSREVSDYEPTLALDGGEDGLDIYRRLLNWCKQALKPNGAFAFELHENCLEQAANEAIQAGFSEVRVIKDLADRERILTGRWS